MRILFIYPESYLNIGIPGGIAVMSALLKQRGHKVDIFDTCFLKTKDYQNTEEVHGGVGLSDKGGVSVFKKLNTQLRTLLQMTLLLNYLKNYKKK